KIQSLLTLLTSDAMLGTAAFIIFPPGTTPVSIIVLVSLAMFYIFLFVMTMAIARRHIWQPIEALQKASDRVVGGDFSHRAPILSNDETALLARRFNTMLDQVDQSVIRYRQLFENATDFL